MDRREMEQRTFEFAKRIVKLAAAMPSNPVGRSLGNQVLRSGTAMGANYREAIRASSRRHFITTLEIAQCEAAETQYWLELLAESDVVSAKRLVGLHQECSELLAILTATIRTAKRRKP